MPRRRKPKGPKRVPYELIKPDLIHGIPMYQLLSDLVDAHHTELTDARIGLAWALSWRPDVDGRLKLGMCRRASDLDRELADFDFVVLLNKTFWQNVTVTLEQRAALLDHELCHATVKLDDRTNEPVRDERGRKVYRIRKHDIEEFADIVRRYGCYKRDLELFAGALLARAATETFEPCETCRESGQPGYVPVVDHGVTRITRCQCWLDFQERRREALVAS